MSQNIKDRLLTPNNLMQSEPRLLLQDFISEIHNYWAVLRAIANNARTPKDISTYTGLPNVQIPKYLSVLSEAGFVYLGRAVPGMDLTQRRGQRPPFHA